MDIRERGPLPYETDEARMVVLLRVGDMDACPHEDCEHEMEGEGGSWHCLTCGCEDEVVVELPGRFEVCSVCDGKGSHVNPSVDSHGITSEEWERDWDDEEREGYFSGRYDVTCSSCGGRRVEMVVDAERAKPEDLKLFERKMREASDDARERDYERRMGY